MPNASLSSCQLIVTIVSSRFSNCVFTLLNLWDEEHILRVFSQTPT